MMTLESVKTDELDTGELFCRLTKSHNMAVPGLLYLAPELLHIIIQCIIPEWESTMDTDLYRLARVSRRLYNITEPFLYTKFIQEDSIDSKSTSALLRTLLEKPEYASRLKIMRGCIRSTNEREYYGPKKNDVAEGANGSEDLPLRMVNVCKKFNIPSDKRLTLEQWIHALTTRSPEACFAILVLLLPNLKSLEMITYTNCDDENAIFISQALNLTTQQLDNVLPNLENLSYGADESSIHMEEITPFIYLSTLRKVSLDSLSVDEDFTWAGPLTSHIVCLEIESSGIADEVWPVLLQPMRQLKRLTYTPGNPKIVGDMENSPEGLGAGLRVVKSTLEYLYVGEYFLEYEVSHLGILHDFPRLREIDIQMGILIGLEENKSKDELWEMLPFALEKATFKGGPDAWSNYNDKCRQDMVEQVIGVILRSETHFPTLKYISMSYYGDLDLEPLKAACTGRGIVLNDW
jgi:hypothetical protein